MGYLAHRLQKSLSRLVQLMAGARTAEEAKRNVGLFPEKLANTAPAQEELTKAMQKWGRYVIVDDAVDADVVFVLREWHEVTKWGNKLQCHDELLAFEGGTIPTDKSAPIWQIQDGQWGGCSAAKRTVRDFRSELETAEREGT